MILILIALILIVLEDRLTTLHLSSAGTCTMLCLIYGIAEKKGWCQMKESLLTTSIHFL